MPNTIKRLIALTATMLLCGCAGPFSQMELAGQVVDITTGQPVPDVYVSIFQSGLHPLRDLAHMPRGGIGIGWGMVKTDNEGKFRFETPWRTSTLTNRHANIHWYHPCYRSPTNPSTDYSYLIVYESTVNAPAQHSTRVLYGSKQNNLILKIWPESKGLEYNDGAEYDPEYASREGLKLTGRGYYLDKVGIAFDQHLEEGWPDLKVAWATFWLDYEFSHELDKKYYFKDPYTQPTDPIPASEPRSPFDCNKPIAPQLPAAMEKSKRADIQQHKASVLEALKMLESDAASKESNNERNSP
ncbi:MAG: hypothetical protein HPY82_25650 [Gammaproteobacteria bacterium]|nr:hypothetical protein [Gammaproteobacteria bacterium]